MKILCVCLGNNDRSPVMAAVLNMFLKNAGHTDSICESAGVSDSAKSGSLIGKYGVIAAKLIGLDISGHKRQHVEVCDLDSYDLIITASDEIAGTLVEKHGVPMNKLYNAQIPNPWPLQFQGQYAPTMARILAAMYEVMGYYFPSTTQK